MKHLRYLWYVLKHKYFVFLECCKLGVPMRGLLHDLSKFSRMEWSPYVEQFFGEHQGVRKASWGFDLAWLHHQHCNPHHHQYWALHESGGGIEVFEMPMGYRKEMLADWRAMSRTQGGDTAEWYLKKRSTILLARETREWVEGQLGIIS